MSLSANDILRALTSANVKTPETNLHNPDIPSPNEDYDEQDEIRDMALDVLKLPKEPQNGGYFRLKNNSLMDPKQESFLLDHSIDPNTIRSYTEPDKTISTVYSNDFTKYSLVPGNLSESNDVRLIQEARQSFVNYKDRFQLPQSTNTQ